MHRQPYLLVHEKSCLTIFVWICWVKYVFIWRLLSQSHGILLSFHFIKDVSGDEISIDKRLVEASLGEQHFVWFIDEWIHWCGKCLAVVFRWLWIFILNIYVFVLDRLLTLIHFSNQMFKASMVVLFSYMPSQFLNSWSCLRSLFVWMDVGRHGCRWNGCIFYNIHFKPCLWLMTHNFRSLLKCHLKLWLLQYLTLILSDSKLVLIW